MLIKVNSLIYKTKVNIKIKQKIRITYVLILKFFFFNFWIRKNWTGKLIKKHALVMDCHQNSVAPWNKIRVNQILDFKNHLIHPNLSHNRREFCRQSLSDWLIFILFSTSSLSSASLPKTTAKTWFSLPSLNGCLKLSTDSFFSNYLESFPIFLVLKPVCFPSHNLRF